MSQAAAIADELSRRREADPPVRDRLMTTLFLVAMLHAIVILGVTFGAPGALLGDAPQLEVMVVSDPLPEPMPNLSADYFAQVNQHGSGTGKNTGAAEAPRAMPAAASGPGSPDSERGEGTSQGDSEGEDSLVETRTRNDREASFSIGSTGIRHGAPLVMEALSTPAGILPNGQDLHVQGQPSKELVVTANTRESSVAVYLDGWRRRVETLGTLNYPMQAVQRHKATGDPELEVQILADGTLGEARVKRTSGDPELDQAALAILKLAAPFPAFPPKLAAKHDALRLKYEWQFLGGSSVESTVRVPANTQ